MKNFKIQVKTYNPEKNDYVADKTYIVQRSPRNELDTIVELQKEILYKFIDSSASAGELIRDNDTWNTLKTLANNLNILGKKERGFDLEEISDDIEQVCQIFMTQSMKDDGTYEETETPQGNTVLWKPSLISELHQLNFDIYWQESVKKILEKKELEKKERKN